MPRVATKVSEGISFEDEDDDPLGEEEQPCCENCSMETDDSELKDGICEDCRCSNCDGVDCDCWECGSCDTRYSPDSGECCDNCETCSSCCDCYECGNCGGKYGPYSGMWCSDCDQCSDCCGCSDDDGDQMGQSEQAPWVARGLTVTYSELRAENALGPSEDWNKYWKIRNNDIDPAQAMCDFYLLDGIAGMVFNGCAGIRRDQMCVEIAQRAKTMKDELIDSILPSFRSYADMAIGGELRYHRAVGNNALDRGFRHMAWIDWFLFRQKAGDEAVADAAKLFREIDHGGIGGEPWAVAADILYGHLTGKIDAATFCDRIFTLQHNGGAFLNKIPWNHALNRPRWGLGEMSSRIGPAHSNNPTLFHILLAAASGPVSVIFSEWWRASNAARRSLGLAMTPKPTWRDHMELQSSRSKPMYRYMQNTQHGGDEEVFASWNARLYDNDWLRLFPNRPFKLPSWWTGYHTAYLCIGAWVSWANKLFWNKEDVDASMTIEELVNYGNFPKVVYWSNNDWYVGSGSIRWMRILFEDMCKSNTELPTPTQDELEMVAYLMYTAWSTPELFDMAKAFATRMKLGSLQHPRTPTDLATEHRRQVFTIWAEWTRAPKVDPWTLPPDPFKVTYKKPTMPPSFWSTSSSAATLTESALLSELKQAKATVNKIQSTIASYDLPTAEPQPIQGQSAELVIIDDVAPSDSEEFEF